MQIIEIITLSLLVHFSHHLKNDLKEFSLTYDEVDELGRGELEEGIAELDGGRARPRGAEGADQRGQDGDGPAVGAEGHQPVALVPLVPVALPDRHDPGAAEEDKYHVRKLA